jgi:hypothetical protein
MSELISTYAPANVEQELPVVSTVTDMNYSSSCYATDVPFSYTPDTYREPEIPSTTIWCPSGAE